MGQNIIFIDENPASKGQQIQIVLRNNAHQELVFFNEAGPVGPNNYHFELSIRNHHHRYFSNHALEKITLDSVSQKVYTMKRDLSNSRYARFYFLINDVKSYSIDSCSLKRIALDGFKASGKDGPHTNINVTLDYQLAHYPSTTDSLSNRLRATINTKYPSGLEHIPLHAGLLNEQSILNNGTDFTNLTIGLKNITNLDTLSGPVNPIHYNKNSKITIAFLLEPHDHAPWKYPWALTTQNLFKGINIPDPIVISKKDTIRGLWQAALAPDGLSWDITPQVDSILAPDDILAIDLKNIKSHMPEGVSYIDVYYHNILGYFDGHFTVPVLKGNVYVEDGNVGIGMKPLKAVDNRSSLAVNGGVYATTLAPPYDAGFSFSNGTAQGLYSLQSGEISLYTDALERLVINKDAFLIKDNSSEQLRIDNNGTTTIKSRLTVTKNMTSKGGIYSSKSPNHVDINNTGFAFQGAGNKGTGLFSLGRNSLEIYTKNSRRFFIVPDGSVGFYQGLTVNGSVTAAEGAPGGDNKYNTGFAFTKPGDNDSGLFSNSTGELSLYSNSIEQMNIDDDGLITYNNVRAASGMVSNGDSISVPYGTTDDWVIMLSLGKADTRNFKSIVTATGGPRFQEVAIFRFYRIISTQTAATANYNNKAWKISCKVNGAAFVTDKIFVKPMEIRRDCECEANYLLVKK